MMDSHEDHQDQHGRPHDRLVEVDDDVKNGQADEPLGNSVRTVEKQRIDGVSAVELADRHHVESRNEHANPAGHKIRIELRDANPLTCGPLGMCLLEHPLANGRHVKLELTVLRNSAEIQILNTPPENG